MGFWTSSRSFSLRKISLDQKLEIFMSKNFFFEKKMNPATANLQGCGMEQLQGTPQELLKNFMRWSQKNYLILFGSMAATTICLSFNYFQKSFFCLSGLNSSIPTLEFQVLALHKSCYDVIAWYICNAKVSHTYLSVTIHWYLLKEWLF